MQCACEQSAPPRAAAQRALATASARHRRPSSRRPRTGERTKARNEAVVVLGAVGRGVAQAALTARIGAEAHDEWPRRLSAGSVTPPVGAVTSLATSASATRPLYDSACTVSVSPARSRSVEGDADALATTDGESPLAREIVRGSSDRRRRPRRRQWSAWRPTPSARRRPRTSTPWPVAPRRAAALPPAGRTTSVPFSAARAAPTSSRRRTRRRRRRATAARGAREASGRTGRTTRRTTWRRDRGRTRRSRASSQPAIVVASISSKRRSATSARARRVVVDARRRRGVPTVDHVGDRRRVAVGTLHHPLVGDALDKGGVKRRQRAAECGSSPGSDAATSRRAATTLNVSTPQWPSVRAVTSTFPHRLEPRQTHAPAKRAVDRARGPQRLQRTARLGGELTRLKATSGASRAGREDAGATCSQTAWRSSSRAGRAASRSCRG